MWRSKERDEETLKCPICPAVLGRRDKNAIFMAHCEECRATFTWRPLETKPTVMMDKDIKRVQRYCDKDGCHCRT